jgi:hypothetical protein
VVSEQQEQQEPSRDVVQLARFMQARDAATFGVILDGVQTPTWEDSGESGQEEYLKDAAAFLLAASTLGYRRHALHPLLEELLTVQMYVHMSGRVQASDSVGLFDDVVASAEAAGVPVKITRPGDTGRCAVFDNGSVIEVSRERNTQ